MKKKVLYIVKKYFLLQSRRSCKARKKSKDDDAWMDEEWRKKISPGLQKTLAINNERNGKWWRRGESNPRPKSAATRSLHA